MKRACYSFHKVCLFIPGAHHHKSRRKNCTRNKKSSEQSEVFWLFELDDHRPFYVYPLCYLTVQSGPVIFVFHKYCIIQPTSPASNTLFFPLSPNSSCSFARARARSLSLSVCLVVAQRLREHPAHVTPDSRVVEQRLDGTDGRDGNVLVPNLSPCKVHDVLRCHCVDGPLDLAGAHPSAGGDNLATDVLGQGGGAVKRQEDGSLELGLGALGLGLAYGLGQAGPLTQGEVDEVVNLGKLVGDEVDAPETMICHLLVKCAMTISR